MTKIQTVRVVPVAGRTILMPERAFQAVPPEGARVYLDAFYTRTINQGDLTVVPDVAPAAPTVAPEVSAVAPAVVEPAPILPVSTVEH